MVELWVLARETAIYALSIPHSHLDSRVAEEKKLDREGSHFRHIMIPRPRARAFARLLGN